MSKSDTKGDASTVSAKSTRSYKKKSMGPVGQSKADSSKKQMPKSVVPKNLSTKQGPKAIVQSKTKYMCKKSGPKTIKGAPVKKQPIETKKIPASLDEEEKAAREGPFGWQTLVQPETKIINRNFYEEVSASDKKPDDREHEGVPPPTSDRMPAKKKTPESDQKLTMKKIPQTDSERNGSVKEPHKYETVTPRECVSDGWSESDRYSGSDRKPPKKKKKKSWSERKVPNLIKRHACKGAIALVVVLILILGGISCLTVLLIMGKGTSKAPANQTSETELDSDLPIYEGQAATFFEGACMKKYPNVNRFCLAGSPPGLGSCSGNGTCTQFAYRVKRGQQAGKYDFLDGTNVTSDQWPATTKGMRQLCKPDQNRLGVCSENECDHLYRDQEKKNWWGNAQWEDNCDVPNPCWEGDTKFFQNPTLVTREQCRNSPPPCSPDQDAIVWMQHLRCNIAKNRTTSGGCTGLPIRLWLCKACKRTSDPPCIHAAFVSSNVTQCTYSCESWTGNKEVYALPDGHNCTYTANPKAAAYCFGGQCFPIYSSVTATNPMNQTVCNQTWAKYDSVVQ